MTFVGFSLVAVGAIVSTLVANKAGAWMAIVGVVVLALGFLASRTKVAREEDREDGEDFGL